MTNNTQSNKIDPRMILAAVTKDLKNQLPKSCTFLAPYKKTDGSFILRAKISGESYDVSLPDGLEFNPTNINYMFEQLNAVCNKN